MSVIAALLAIDPVVSSTNMTSVLGRRMSASHVTRSDEPVTPRTRISVVGTTAVTTPDTLPPLSLKVRTRFVLPYEPAAKLASKNCSADALLALFQVPPPICLRPASAPASQPCCIRVLVSHRRLMSMAPPTIPASGIIDAAAIASVLPA